MGIPFRELARIPSSCSVESAWLEASSIFALAWAVGFVAVWMPAGFGVRESVLAVLLAPKFGMADALSIALAGRIWWAIGEWMYIIPTTIWVARRIDPGGIISGGFPARGISDQHAVEDQLERSEED